MLQEIYGCSAEQRKSLVPYTFAVTKSGGVAVNFSAVADNGFVRSTYRMFHIVLL